MTSSFEGFAVSVEDQPPCIKGLESDGAYGFYNDTAPTFEYVLVWLREVIDSSYAGEGSCRTPFESWLMDDPALPGGDGNRDDLIFWACEKCEKGLSQDEAEAIIQKVATGARRRFICDEAKTASGSFGEVCDPENCPRCKAPSKVDEAMKYLEGIGDALKKNPVGLNDPRTIGALRVVFDGNRLFFNTFLKKIGPGRDAIKTLKEMMDPPESEPKKDPEPKVPEVSDEIKQKAVDLLRSGGLIDSIITATNRQMKGGEDLRRLAVASGVSTYMDGAKLHLSAVGEPQTGKTAHTDAVMNHLPEEDVIPLSEVSPQAFYYMSKKMDFDKKIVRIDDAKEGQIPVIKVIEDDSPTPAKKYTVIDGEGVELGIQGRPVLWTTSVGPLVDRSGQTVSRSLMISPDGVTSEEDDEVKAKIWETEQFGTARATEDDDARQIHQTAFRMLRGPGSGAVLIPFTVDPPKNCSRRGTRQFATLIKSLAFINQFKRVRFYRDGKRYILANFDDLQEAARLWFAFFDLQTHKSGGKWVRDILVCLETSPPEVELGRQDPKCRTPKEIVELSDLPTRTVNSYLKDLYEAGIVDREHIRAPGNPFAYWISAKYATANKSISQDSDIDLGGLSKTGSLPKYLRDNQVQETSISIFFNKLGRDNDEWELEKNNGHNLAKVESSREKITSLYLRSFRLNPSDDSGESDDNDSHQVNEDLLNLHGSPKSPDGAQDSDPLGKDSVGGSLPNSEAPKIGKIVRPTPEPKPKVEPSDEEEESRPPTTEEAEILGEEAGRLLQNWPGVPEMELWERVRDRLGKPLPLSVVRSWLKTEGYVETGQRLNGASLWNPPTSEGVRA